MGKKLVIVESPAKAKTIGKMLGSTYVVKSSVGHVRDLPEKVLGVDVKKDFEPKYVLSKGKTKIVSELKKAVKSCDAIYLAPDPDREGEAIAWHLYEILKPAGKEKPFYRIQYNQITASAVKAAIENPGEINMNRVDAQQARRILDRLVGYKVSPMLWRRIKRGLSAGRVQSVALRLVAEREREILGFKIEEYWVMGATMRRQSEPLDPFTTKLSRIGGESPDIKSEAAAEALLEDLEGSQLKVDDVATKEVTRRALPPFITSTLQQSASSLFGFSPQRTMGVAQKLYEGVDTGDGSPTGLITYMRTDSVNISKEARDEARAYIEQRFGGDFIPEKPNFFKSRTSAQEAHEAIRPTDVSRTPESLKGVLGAQELKLYDLIWRRFLASQMSAAKIARKTAMVVPERAGQRLDYLFTATASEITFEGFLKVMALDIRKKKDDAKEDSEEGAESDEVDTLPPLTAGDMLDLVEWLSERKETKPPARFSEASLIRALEANGVGRPSTYASIIETLNNRNYTTREKRQLTPTELGLEVNDLLVLKLPELFDVGFTANMEEQLDSIEDGKVNWTAMMREFYTSFEEWMEKAKEPPADQEKVDAMMAMLEKVTVWGAEVQRGKRKYSDQKFVKSIADQIKKAEKGISDRQLEALVKIAVRYKDQIPGAEPELTRMGFAEFVESDNAALSYEKTMQRFDMIDKLMLSESQGKFFESLKQQVASGRKLSKKQVIAVDRMLVQYSAKIKGFEELRESLELTVTDSGLPQDNESPVLMEMLGQVQTWSEPVTRGKMTFDDKAFYSSLNEQFLAKDSLTPRQRYALKRMIFRYKAQITDFDGYVEKLGLNKKSKS
ncbi:MAG: type I DNA topoisomerase [Kiritimatiellae bacterium]|nr:type I DNA topoisomerase [Kiritimatiellia bacterium]